MFSEILFDTNPEKGVFCVADLNFHLKYHSLDCLSLKCRNFCINQNLSGVIIVDNAGGEISSSVDQYIYILGFFKIPVNEQIKKCFPFFTLY